MDARHSIELVLTTHSPTARGEAIFSIPTETRQRLTVVFCHEAGWDCRFTKGRPAYSKASGWHLLVRVMEGWCHVTNVDEGSAGDWATLVSWLTIQCCGEWTLYRGRADR